MATLRWARNGSHGGPEAHRQGHTHRSSRPDVCAPAHCPTASGRRPSRRLGLLRFYSDRPAPVKNLFRAIGGYSIHGRFPRSARHHRLRRGDARPHLGAGPGMTWTQGILLGVAVAHVHLPGRRHVQAREVLDGLHLDHRHPGHRPGPHLAVPRVLHGRGVRRPGPLPGLGRAAGLPGPRDRPRTGAELEALRRLDGHLLGRRHGRHLPDHPDPGVAARSTRSTSVRSARPSASTPPRRS